MDVDAITDADVIMDVDVTLPVQATIHAVTVTVLDGIQETIIAVLFFGLSFSYFSAATETPGVIHAAIIAVIMTVAGLSLSFSSSAADAETTAKVREIHLNLPSTPFSGNLAVIKRQRFNPSAFCLFYLSASYSDYNSVLFFFDIPDLFHKMHFLLSQVYASFRPYPTPPSMNYLISYVRTRTDDIL